MEAVRRQATNGPAHIFRISGFKGELGFITPMSEHHCRTCNRLRLSSDGKIRPCLLRSQELDLKGPLRQGVSDGLIGYLFQEAIRLKHPKASNPWSCSGSWRNDLPMVSIGG
jgi:cyclic pyranopterin phosphate synthase